MKSLLQTDKACYITGCTERIEKHHIFGAANRKHSEKYGLWVYLLHDLHNEPPQGVHHNMVSRILLQKLGQMAFERAYPDLDFRQIFGKNYL